jgi:hypothetical protein
MRRALADAIRLVEKVVPVAQRLLCILIDRNGDCLEIICLSIIIALVYPV